jgi:ERCC4-type nuclease
VIRQTRLVDELLIARNPDPDSSLPYLLRVPLGVGLVFRTSGTWPRTKALFCYPVHVREWPEKAEVVERIPVRSCVRRGAAIDLVLARSRENRSQIVYTKGRGRDMVFWQSPRTRKQARPNVSVPTARAAGVPDLAIVVDSHERYAYRFAGQQVQTRTAPLPCGDYGLELGGELVASVERKSLSDLVSSVTDGRLRFALGELAALPRSAVVVEDRYSQLLKVDWVRPALVLDGLAELQVRWPNVPIVFCENRSLAEEWTYRFLAAARVWAETEAEAIARIASAETATVSSKPSRSVREPDPDEARRPPVGEVRAWARQHGIPVSDRGRLGPEVWDAWTRAHP